MSELPKNDPIVIAEQKDFNTGAIRDRPSGKGCFYALSPIGLRRLAARSEFGAIKYGDPRNWEKGMPIHEFLDSAMRHLNQYNEGDTSEDHLAAASWNIHAMMHLEETMPQLMDIPTRPEYKKYLRHQRELARKEKTK